MLQPKNQRINEESLSESDTLAPEFFKPLGQKNLSKEFDRLQAWCSRNDQRPNDMSAILYGWLAAKQDILDRIVGDA